MTSYNLTPAPFGQQPGKGNFAKGGMSRKDFDAWLAKNVFNEPLYVMQTDPYGGGKRGAEFKPSSTDADALWELYQHYGTLDATEASAYTIGQHETGPGPRPPISTTLGSTIGQANADAKSKGVPGPSTPSTPKTAAGAPPAGAAAPDIQSAINKTTDPALKAILQQALAGGLAGTVTLWSGAGVDPQATVLGAQDRWHTNPGGIGPYTSGHYDVKQSADLWLKGLYKMSPQDLSQLQHRLWEQGWYSGTKVTNPNLIEYGRPDAATVQAYGEVLSETARYNAAGKPINIDGVIGMGSPLKSVGGQGAPYATTNPADLKAALTSESQQLLGRDPTPQEVAAYSESFIPQEAAARRAMVEAQIANTTTGVESAPTPTAGADQFIDTHDLQQKINYGTIARQQAFFSMLKSPV